MALKLLKVCLYLQDFFTIQNGFGTVRVHMTAAFILYASPTPTSVELVRFPLIQAFSAPLTRF